MGDWQAERWTFNILVVFILNTFSLPVSFDGKAWVFHPDGRW